MIRTTINFSFDNSVVTLGVNQGLSGALTAADQVLNSLLFGDLLYFATDNEKDELKFCNIRFDND